jgi:hypothetical protein
LPQGLSVQHAAAPGARLVRSLHYPHWCTGAATARTR